MQIEFYRHEWLRRYSRPDNMHEINHQHTFFSSSWRASRKVRISSCASCWPNPRNRGALYAVTYIHTFIHTCIPSCDLWEQLAWCDYVPRLIIHEISQLQHVPAIIIWPYSMAWLLLCWCFVLSDEGLRCLSDANTLPVHCYGPRELSVRLLNQPMRERHWYESNNNSDRIVEVN